MELAVVILAAGQGKRMRSALAKVLHPLAGRPMVTHVVAAARSLQPAAIHLVYGHGGEAVRAALPDPDLHWVEQAEQLGTGHAVAQAMPAISDAHRVLVLCADVPLISAGSLERLLEVAGNEPGLLTVRLADPSGYGRVLREAGDAVAGIVEEKDASPEQRAVDEVNTGLMCLPAGHLRDWLARLSSDNAQGEYYLTDVIAMARADGVRVHAVEVDDPLEVQGVNNRAQLARLERHYQRQSAERLMAAGVTLMDPARIDIRGELTCASDVTIDVNCVFEGQVELAERVSVGPNCLLRDVRLGPGTVVEACSVLEGVETESAAAIGPFARLRPGTRLADGAKVGNFVEIKHSQVGPGSKVNHLSYVGDTRIGKRVNVGAGTITCNYDGARKHPTVIEDEVFIGSDTQLVAPVTVGRGATVGAGSTVTRDVPAGQLVLSRVPQTTVEGWERPTKGTSK